MTPEKLCQELSAYYERPLSTPQMKPIVKHIDGYPQERVRALYDLIVNTCEFLPKLSRIIELAEQLGHSNKVGCPKCRFTGFVEAKTKVRNRNERISRYQHVAMCECHPGRKPKEEPKSKQRKLIPVAKVVPFMYPD